MAKLIKIYFLIFCISWCFSINAQQAYSFTTESQVFVIGDIHGAFEAVETTLKTLDLIDQQNNWSGGTAHFVSLGDIVDRGPASRKVMDLFMQLQSQAEQAGGKFHIVLGNHEIMNLQRELRYLSAEEINAFSDDETSEQRSIAYQKYIDWNKLPDLIETQTKFNETYPPGYFAHQQAFSRSGKYGQWLIGLPFIIKINDQLFTHAGLSKRIPDEKLKTINQTLKSQLVDYLQSWNYFVEKNQLFFDLPVNERIQYVNNFDDSPEKKMFLETHNSLVFSINSPTWYRGSALCHPYFEQDILLEKLQMWDATRLWVGHTTTANNVQYRFSDQLVIIDTGMLNSYYHGQPWAAKIESNGNATYINGLSAQVSVPVQAAKREYSNPYNMSDKEVENFLQTARITNKESTKEGRTNPFKVRLEKNGKIIHGIFKYKDSHFAAHKGRWSGSKNKADRYQYEIAAYKLDRMLGIGLVPVTVERKIDNKSGIIQIWIEGLISQLQYYEKKIPYTGFCDYRAQLNMMDTFDYLILNTDRNQSNIMFSKGDGQIWFIDHSKSFGTSIRRPKVSKKYAIKVSKAFKTALEKLTLEQLNELNPWLHKKQIQAIWKRRGILIRGGI